jgi:hypothetical protein
MHGHFNYHSQTQRMIHVMPFLWLICATGWLGYMSDETSELAGILGLLAFGWLYLSKPLMDALVLHRGGRFGPIDLSKNGSPTSIEKLINWLILAVAIAAGGVTASRSVQGVAHVEAKILIAVIVFLVIAGLIDGALTLAVMVLSGFRIRPVRG